MNDLAYRYTEEHYCTKQEISKHLSVSMIDPVWKEVEGYRQLFMIRAKGIRPLDFCLCSGILLRLLRIQESFGRNHAHLGGINELTGLETVLSEEAQWIIYHWQQLSLDLAQMIHEAFICFHGMQQKVWREALMEECLPVECRWILLISQCEPRELAVSLCLALALHYGKLAEIRLLLPSLIFMKAERDGTYALQKMITLLESRIQKLPMDSEAIPLDLTSLRYQYPQLRDYQIRFYLEHSVKGYFYTLEQFVAFSGVCYETARCAMEQLVDLHFYDKLKQGKKFVYTRP